jgi:hypothetical protein
LVELIAYSDNELEQVGSASELIKSHLEECISCRVALERAAPRFDLPSDGEAFDQSQLDGILSVLDEISPEPASGQLWRLRWEDTVAMAVVLNVDDQDVRVAPACLDSWLADDYAVFVSKEWSPLRASLAVWTSLISTVPLCVLDRYLGEVDVLDQVQVTWEAFRKGGAVPGHIPVGDTIVSPLDERWQFRRQLAADFSVLSDAGWSEPSAGTGDGSLGAMLDGIEPQAIGEALDLLPPDVFILLRGETPLNAEQADRLAELTAISPSELMSASPPVPREILREISHPRNRARLEERAARSRWSYREVRVRACTALVGTAARYAGQSDAPIDWHRVLQDWLQE